MKKIVLGTMFLMILCSGISRADLIDPGETPWWESLDKLSEEKKLETCKQIKEDFPDIENESAIFPLKKRWNRLECLERLDKQTTPNPNAENPSKSPSSNSTPQADSSEISSLQYGLAGLVTLLLSVAAFVLLWRTRKPNSPNIP
ncbi:MAG: hypothetical protein J6V32_02270 [Elusimicrobiaceae bacterium]|nr:hypothetical protein [Elusimicrobiaceae bacterium]